MILSELREGITVLHCFLAQLDVSGAANCPLMAFGSYAVTWLTEPASGLAHLCSTAAWPVGTSAHVGRLLAITGILVANRFLLW